MIKNTREALHYALLKLPCEACAGKVKRLGKQVYLRDQGCLSPMTHKLEQITFNKVYKKAVDRLCGDWEYVVNKYVFEELEASHHYKCKADDY